MKISRIYYLIHPMIYTRMAEDDPQALQDTNAGIYLERELLCEPRWRAAIQQTPTDAIYAQLGGGPEILKYAKQQIDGDRIIVPEADYEPEMDLEAYRRNLTASFCDQLSAGGHQIDPQTTQLELWGESFEGCVHTYGTALARHLGLRRPAFNNFEMTVPDARFLCRADAATHFLLEDAPVRGYVFDEPEGCPIGVFLDGFLQDDHHAARIRLAIDPNKVTVVTKMGITMYARLSIDRPDRKIAIEPMREDKQIAVTHDGLGIPRHNPCYVVGNLISSSTFLAAMRAAQVTD